MKHFFTGLLLRVEAEIKQIDAKPTNKIEQLTKCCIAFSKAYQQLQQFLKTHTFNSEQHEIDYFKQQKPQIVSRLMHYQEIRHIEIHKPRGSVKALKNYLEHKLNKLEHNFNENTVFINYYRSGENAMDHIYFTRHQMDSKLATERFSVDNNLDQCTLCDGKVSGLLCDELTQTWIEEQLALLEAPALRPTVVATSVKIRSGLTVAQIALFFRLQNDCGIINHKVSREIFEHIAQSYQNPNAANISPDSIKNKFYTFDNATISAVKDKLLEMLNLLNEL